MAGIYLNARVLHWLQGLNTGYQCLGQALWILIIIPIYHGSGNCLQFDQALSRIGYLLRGRVFTV